MAIYWCGRAAAHGYAKAEFNLGLLYASGPQRLRDPAAAELWLTQAADRGFAPAQYALGRYYQKQGGMLAVQALGWFRKAADQSHPKAVYRIALAYETGDCGVPVNKPRAAAWMRHAAQLGYPPAQYEIGRRGLFGQAPGIVPGEAITWLDKAACQGHVRAQYGLAMCFAKGVGVERDLVRAWLWLSLAAEQDFPKAKYKLPLVEAELEPRLLQDARRQLQLQRRGVKPGPG